MSRKEISANPRLTSGSSLMTSESQLSQRSAEVPKSATVDQCVYNSRLSDSGVWSSSNIQSEEISTPESPNSKSSEFTFSSDKMKSESKSCMRLDSGIDVSVSQQLSELHLEEPDDCTCLNDLSSKSKPSNINANFSTGQKTSTEQISQFETYFQQNEDGDTQLHLTIVHKFIEVVYDLMRMVPHPDFLNIRNEERQTPLHLAVLTGQARLARLLVCAGARVDALDRTGDTPLHLAVRADDLPCVRAIIDAVETWEVDAARLRYRPYEFHRHRDIADVHNYDGQTCVHLAALNGSVEVLQHLLWYGADINAKEWKGGRTCLHLAVECGDSALCMFLLAQAHLDTEETDYAGCTPYQVAHAAWDRDARIVAALRDHGVDTWLPTDQEDDSDQEMVELPVARGLTHSSHQLNGGGLVNVGA